MSVATSENALLKSQDRGSFPSTLPASEFDRRLAIAAVAILALLFAFTLPFAKAKLAEIPAFVASYQFALAAIDIITALLLYGQFNALRSRGLLLLASGYLFTALAAMAHALTFPGLFAPTGLLSSGPQTTVWLYMCWHGVFPLLVIGYGLSTRDDDLAIGGSARGYILGSIAAVCAVIAITVWAVTGGHNFLPILLHERRYTAAMIGIVSSVWLLSLAALVVLWKRRPHSVLDVWLMVVMCAWLFDIALSAILNEVRFDLGFYLGRIYGLAAASFVLAVLLLETGKLQAQLANLLKQERSDAAVERDRHREREEFFGAVIASSNDVIVTKSLDGVITGWNAAAERLFGYSADEAVGHSIDLIVPAERRSEVRVILESIRQGDVVGTHETRRIAKSGREILLSLSVSPIKARDGKIIGATKIARDLTEVRLAQEALSESERMALGIIETSLDAFVQMSNSGIVIDWNSQAERIFGWSRKEALGRDLGELIVPEAHRAHHRQALSRLLHDARAIHGSRFEIEAQRRDGAEVRVEFSVTVFQRRGGHVFNAFIRDLTDKIAAENQIRQAQKMDAVGQLTGGVAHDFNNILTVITGTIEILAEGVADRPELASIAHMIDEAAARGADLTGHLLAFARRQPLQPREIDVNTLILTTSKLLRPTLGEQIEIETLLADDPWLAYVDPNQLTTAVLNLALNARDAMPQGGRLIIETINSYLDEIYAGQHSEVKPGEYVLIAISDTGSGIPAHLIDKVFEPFFTTKDIGKGTGLGLSMVYGFVKQSEGHIKVYSEEGHGTTIKLYLPKSKELSAAAIEVDPVEKAIGGNELILVVEDDLLVRNYVVTQVRSLGYRTLSAANAEEALDAIRSDPTIDLLFTDVIMPGSMNGRQLVEEVRKLRGEFKVLYTSGYTENAIVHHGRLDPGILLLAKPYRKADLARMIRLALDGGDKAN
ncbi:PAS domain S-box protein [Bradyrhizobium sp. SYSU BS000235]|uniref:PAS domain S-box protein n=1 Tax=Bradyrhizobium sp. SYSU BS000235 TaxID=3411332 RepID=UPI003C75D619